MADLENLLLEAARRKTTSGGRHNSSMRAKRRHEGSYSDEPGYSKSSSDEDSNDPGFGHRKPSGSQNPLKKRFDTSEKDDDTGRRDEGHDDGGGHDYSDSDSSDVGSDLYKDDYDREKLSKLTELEREMILADRAESRDDILKKKKHVSWQVEKKVRPAKEVIRLPGGRTASTTTKPGKSEYKDALVELAARRKAQDASIQRKKRDSTTRGDRQYSPKRKVTIASPVSDSPPGRGRGKSVDSGAREEDEDRSEESKEANASSHGSNMDESDDDGPESGVKSATFEDIKTITVRHSRLFEWFLEPFFEDVIVGCFIRVAIGMPKTGHDIHKLCVVRNVDVHSYGRDESYKFENKTTNKYLMCVRGNEALAARWEMTRVSESPPLEEEFTELLQEIERDGGHIPTKDEVLQKREGFEKIINSATVKRMLQEKKSASLRPTNVATEKEHLRKELEVAMGKDNHYEVQRIKARLQALEAMSRQVKDKDSKALKLAEMNRKKRQENFKNASELKPVNTSLKAGDASYDPFSRRWTRSTNYYMPSSSTPVPEGDAKEATGEHQKAGEGETAAAGAGKLMDTKAPVDAGTELHLLHDFDLPISPTGLQKFDGPQGAFSAFMEKKQRVEATLGVKVPVNDGRRHALTLTVCDYKGRRGLL